MPLMLPDPPSTLPRGIGIRRGDDIIEPSRQSQPDQIVHVLTADIDDLFARECGQRIQAWHRVQQPVDAEGPRRITVVAWSRLGTGDRSASAQDVDSSLHFMPAP